MTTIFEAGDSATGINRDARFREPATGLTEVVTTPIGFGSGIKRNPILIGPPPSVANAALPTLSRKRRMALLGR